MADANTYVRGFVLIKGRERGWKEFQKRRGDYTLFNRGLHELFTDCSESGANRGELVVEDCAEIEEDFPVGDAGDDGWREVPQLVLDLLGGLVRMGDGD